MFVAIDLRLVVHVRYSSCGKATGAATGVALPKCGLHTSLLDLATSSLQLLQ